MNVFIVIPAYNEENRIKRTIQCYCSFFSKKQERIKLIIVLNGCIDNTALVVESIKKEYPDMIQLISIVEAGKGIAIKKGFEVALEQSDNTHDLIGFVDADMATRPEHFYALIQNIDIADGIVASRYMPGSTVKPTRPLIKRLGSKFVFELLVKLLFGIFYTDYQCGAKLFRRSVIETVTPLLHIKQWAFDVNLLYLCKRFHFEIHETPTVWTDQVGSKLKLSSGFKMLYAILKLRLHYSFFSRLLRYER